MVDISWERLSLLLRAFNELAPGVRDLEGVVGGGLSVVVIVRLSVCRVLAFVSACRHCRIKLGREVATVPLPWGPAHETFLPQAHPGSTWDEVLWAVLGVTPAEEHGDTLHT